MTVADTLPPLSFPRVLSYERSPVSSEAGPEPFAFPATFFLSPGRALARTMQRNRNRPASLKKRPCPTHPQYQKQASATWACPRRGPHVIVGTPGRVIDHMERCTLKLDALSCLVLDEADEMLRMGFIEEVEKVLRKTPPTRRVALFSATMPAAIRRIAQD
jgi:superfamily II DNA/RNA helicase